MSDIEYLSVKEFEGKLRTDEGTQNGVTGDLGTLTASVGKDMYLAKAKVSWEINDAATRVGTVELKINGVAVEKYTFRGESPEFTADSYEFVNIGQKVETGDIIKLEVTQSGTNVDVEGTIVCFEEDTGTSPQIPPLNPV